MKRLSIALSVLLLLNLLTEGLRWLLAAHLLPFTNLWLTALVVSGMVALTYFATLEASPLAYLYEQGSQSLCRCRLSRLALRTALSLLPPLFRGCELCTSPIVKPTIP